MDIIGSAGPQEASQIPVHTNAPKQSSRKKLSGKGMRLLSFVMLISAALLLGALALYLGVGGSAEERKFVDKDKYQAVFLNGGQVYFGKIRTLNNRFVTLDNIYYLRVNQQVQPNQSNNNAAAQDVSLAKLGCELHGPTDVMVINREQVLFWENLKDDGQVVTAVKKFVSENPQGQKCETATDADAKTQPANNNATNIEATP